jgi:TolB-like protein/DNA-binding winged helix-turn-helix (wHTH) protein/Flp pilus assembly protein TadD
VPLEKATIYRFGVFELDPRVGELRKNGVKLKLQDQPHQALVKLLERPGEIVSREELRSTLWHEDTFVDFETGLNTAIKRLRETLGDSADNPTFIETLPRRGYRFIVPVESLVSDLPVHPSNNAQPRAGLHKLWLLASVGVLSAIALLSLGLRGTRKGLPSRRAEQRIESLAVLPLQNLSGDPAQEYFADGMTDELITEVAKISSVRVISRTSIMQYKATHKPLAAIASELGVDAVVEGTIVRSGQKVRITAQLIQARDDRHLWSENYEGDLGDVLRLQGEVAQAIAGRIQGKLTPQDTSPPKARPVNPQAYEAYLKGSFFRNKLTEEGLNRSIELLTQASDLDPSYAQSYAALSLSYVYLGIFGFRPSEDVYPKARAVAIKALERDETLAEAHTALADVKKGYDWDWAGAETEYKRALELNASYSLAHGMYADYLSKRGRYEEAIAEAERSRELDPTSVGRTAFLGAILYRARRYDEAIGACQKALELNPNHPNTFWFLALSHEQKREFPKAIAELEKAIQLTQGGPIYRALLANVYAQAGERAKALSLLDALKAVNRQRYVSPLDIAIVYTGLGDRNSAFHWLEKAYQERTMRIQELPEPIFDSLRSDPRFRDLMRRIGLPTLNAQGLPGR